MRVVNFHDLLLLDPVIHTVRRSSTPKSLNPATNLTDRAKTDRQTDTSYRILSYHIISYLKEEAAFHPDHFSEYSAVDSMSKPELRTRSETQQL